MPCPVCNHPDEDACARSLAAFAAKQEERRQLLDRLGLRTFRNPIGGLHMQWEIRPEDADLFAFLAALDRCTCLRAVPCDCPALRRPPTAHC